jgi:hypothetical protein
MSDIFKFIQNLINQLFGSGQPQPPAEPGPGPAIPPGQAPTPVERKVMLISFNPTVPSEGGKKLNAVMGWNDPLTLAQSFISDVLSVSNGYARYTIAVQQEVDHLPVKEDGFAYTADAYVQCIRSNSGFHQPDTADYARLVNDFDIINQVSSGAVDEVWMMGFPYAGFYESRMVGPGAFWCNAPALGGFDFCPRRFIMMGFSYERGVGEMFESFNHRAESILGQVFRSATGDQNLWERFTRYDKRNPGQASCGTVHFAPNSQSDYDWGNPKPVLSNCDAWYKFPDLSAAPRSVTSAEWGGGDIRLHHLWWLRHFPHLTGSAGGILWNWWAYQLDPNLVK